MARKEPNPRPTGNKPPPPPPPPPVRLIREDFDWVYWLMDKFSKKETSTK
jgi:hypothetical protein